MRKGREGDGDGIELVVGFLRVIYFYKYFYHFNYLFFARFSVARSRDFYLGRGCFKNFKAGASCFVNRHSARFRNSHYSLLVGGQKQIFELKGKDEVAADIIEAVLKAIKK